MFAPLIIRPSTVSRAAPTRNFEYGEYENSLAGNTQLRLRDGLILKLELEYLQNKI